MDKGCPDVRPHKDVVIKPRVWKTLIVCLDPNIDTRVEILMDDKGKSLNNMGAMATLTNEIFDAMRKHYNAHQIKVESFQQEVTKTKQKGGKS